MSGVSSSLTRSRFAILGALSFGPSTGYEKKTTYRNNFPLLEGKLRAWARRPELQLKAGRNELLLKLFFARKEDIPHLLPQVEHYATQIRRMLATYTAFEEEPLDASVPPDARVLIGTTIDYGVAAARIKLDWCELTVLRLKGLAAPRAH